ncbi:MAG: alpha/beta fold hydrolase [Candidatus Staskawiczbacteria bacterium]|jgi:hypothetical protein
MKKVIIVHGYTGYPTKNWFPWLKKELEKQGVEVIVPAMPHTEAPQLAEWLSYLQKIVGEATPQTYLVGHSLGCIAILRYLETLDTQIGGVVLVSGFAEPIHFTELDNFFATDLNDKKIIENTKHIILINSDNDEHVPLWQGQKMAERFNAKMIVLNNAGHINENSGFKELPVVLAEIKNMFES